MFVEHNTNGGSNAQHKRNIKYWQWYVQWKYRSTSWTLLKDLKESDSVEVAEYEVANKIAEKPAFIWWAKNVLRNEIALLQRQSHALGNALISLVSSSQSQSKQHCYLMTKWALSCGRRAVRKK